MITACELCAKITVKNALREETIRIAKMRTAKAFAEEVLCPIIEDLNEVPDHLDIGCRYHTSNARGLFRDVSEKKKGMTNYGNPMESRHLIDEVGGCSEDYSILDYEVLNQYLAEFGFQISTEMLWLETARYSTSTPTKGVYVDRLYLTMTCPVEEF